MIHCGVFKTGMVISEPSHGLIVKNSQKLFPKKLCNILQGTRHINAWQRFITNLQHFTNFFDLLKRCYCLDFSHTNLVKKVILFFQSVKENKILFTGKSEGNLKCLLMTKHLPQLKKDNNSVPALTVSKPQTLPGNSPSLHFL